MLGDTDTLTRYEFVTIYGYRLQQLNRVSDLREAYVPVTDDMDTPEQVLHAELVAHALPFVIRRKMPDGTIKRVSLATAAYPKEFHTIIYG